MSTPLIPSLPRAADSAAAAPALGPAGRQAPAWVREPLLHFLVLGAALFAIDHALVLRADDPRSIVVGSAVDKEAREVFKGARGREPDAKELAALRQVWLDNEVLYREGMALRVDQGDTAIRERVIFKALSVVDANLKLPAIDDQGLRAWFEAHRDKYDEAPRYDFQEAVLSGDNSEAVVRAFVAELNGSNGGEAKAGLRVFKGRPQGSLAQSYGPGFAKALDSLPPAEWQALKTKDGWRAIRLEAISAAKPASFDALRGVVTQDWTDATMAELRTTAVRTLGQKYKVRTDGGQP